MIYKPIKFCLYPWSFDQVQLLLAQSHRVSRFHPCKYHWIIWLAWHSFLSLCCHLFGFSIFCSLYCLNYSDYRSNHWNSFLFWWSRGGSHGLRLSFFSLWWSSILYSFVLESSFGRLEQQQDPQHSIRNLSKVLFLKSSPSSTLRHCQLARLQYLNSLPLPGPLLGHARSGKTTESAPINYELYLLYWPKKLANCDTRNLDRSSTFAISLWNQISFRSSASRHTESS